MTMDTRASWTVSKPLLSVISVLAETIIGDEGIFSWSNLFDKSSLFITEGSISLNLAINGFRLLDFFSI
ncbi:hypothetical protein BpHYR1_030584 [Brachionus plicatilis]|uniref:Uncharacterized protein n=1 Tax=Brachionus plicatilis TaxID=10195 RepID=A0A3M7P8Y4_BRAPC|nr:hypothetical protein BpHYR1_030584 [Brachionus plicatilis]